MTTEISMQMTPQARQSALTGAGLTGSGLAGNGMGGALSFIDLIFTQISPDGGMVLTQGDQQQTLQDGPINTDTTLLDKNATAATIINTRPTQINADATLNTDQADDVVGMLVNDAPLSEEAAAFLETLAQALRQSSPDGNTDIDGLSSETPLIADLSPEARKTLLARLETLIQGLPLDDQTITLPKTPSDELTIDADAISEIDQTLIATGLTPEDITKIVQDIHDGRDLTNDTEGLALLSVIINILPPQSGHSARKAQDIVIMPRSGNPVTSTATPPKSTDANEPAVQSSLNDLLVNPKETTFVEDDGISAGGKTKGFDEILRLMEAAQSNGNTKMAAGLEKALTAVQSGTSPSVALSAQGMDFMNGLGSLINDGSLDGLFPDGAEWARNLNGLNGISITGTANLTSLVTSSANPAAPHPATQAVAIAITKTAQANSDSTLSMRLDPPDLGKLEVHVRFSKDKTMKAHMVIEKPETFLMLQRDSSVLERSLQEAGIDTGNGGLSFELADQSQDWSREGNGRGYEGGTGRNGNGADDGETEIVIESTMNWYTDAATGMQRYDILA